MCRCVVCYCRHFQGWTGVNMDTRIGLWLYSPKHSKRQCVLFTARGNVFWQCFWHFFLAAVALLWDQIILPSFCSPCTSVSIGHPLPCCRFSGCLSFSPLLVCTPQDQKEWDYYHRFLPNYLAVTKNGAPDPLKQTELFQQAFLAIKAILCYGPP